MKKSNITRKKLGTFYNKIFPKKIELILSCVLSLFLLVIFFIMVSFHGKENQQVIESINGYAIQIIMAIFSIIVQFIFGKKYYVNAYKEIFKWKSLGMNTLIALSTGVSFLYSFVVMIFNFIYKNDENFVNIDTMYESGPVIITILMIGDLITDKIRKQANKDLSSLEGLQDSFAYVVENKKIIKKHIKEVRKNEIISISKGSKIPLDGILMSKKTLINESIITGESKPVVKLKNSNLLSGSVNLGEAIKIKVTNLLNDSYLNKIIEKIEELQSQKIKQQKLADKISKIFVPIVLFFAILGFLVQFFFGNVFHHWYIHLDSNYLITWESELQYPVNGYVSLDQISKSIYLFVTILIIACPCSLGLAVPLAISVGSAKALKNSILLNNIDVFEKIKLVNAVAFDKTGTLTTGNFIVEQTIGKNNLSLIFELETFSLHPLAKSYVTWFLNNNKNFKTQKIDNRKIKEIPGVGIVYKEKKDVYLISSLHYVKEKNFFISKKINEAITNLNQNKLYSFIVLSKNKKVETVIVLTDELRPNAKKTIELFKKLKIKTYLITGDSKKTALYLNSELKFDNVYFETNPSEKREIIENIKKEGNFICYVGDGINDVLALENSDLKIVMNQGSEIAKSISEIILINGDIYNVYRTIKIVLQTRRFITFNLIWAFSYNVISIALAIFGFINPILAALIMSLSSISILLNSLIFRFKKIT